MGSIPTRVSSKVAISLRGITSSGGLAQGAILTTVAIRQRPRVRGKLYRQFINGTYTLRLIRGRKVTRSQVGSSPTVPTILGHWCNGNISDSKPADGGSIPSWPAK